MTALLWFRRDLRLDDHPALLSAAEHGAVVPVYVHDAAVASGAAARWWLHHSLKALDKAIRVQGGGLRAFRGPAETALPAFCREAGASRVFWTRGLSPAERAQDERVRNALAGAGVQAEVHFDGLLFEPGRVMTQDGRPHQVFTSFWRSATGGGEPAPPRSAPKPSWTSAPDDGGIDALELLPRVDWTAGFRASWTPGLEGAASAAKKFLGGALAGYASERDVPSREGTSRLSPHLHFGEISVRRLWHAVKKTSSKAPRDASAFLGELGWREFAHHLLHHFPHTTQRPLRPDFERFPWRTDEREAEAWRRGRTGYPIVDAGMRQLWATGWMHNRVRMIAASFLVKDLLLPWTLGAEWFMDTLLDADEANNTLGWQWSAGCGADAAPYFRVFNPVLQGQKFDPAGRYVRAWVPELSRLPDKWIHAPWTAPEAVLSSAGVGLGTDYPAPIVDHGAARARALAAFEKVKKKT